MKVADQMAEYSSMAGEEGQHRTADVTAEGRTQLLLGAHLKREGKGCIRQFAGCIIN